MKKHLLPCLLPLVIALTATSCHHSSGAVWEDTKTLGRYLHRKSRMLWQKDVDSRMIDDENEMTGPVQDEYIPIEGSTPSSASKMVRRATHNPSAAHPKAMKITRDLFISPSGELAEVFQNIYFDTNQYAIRSKKEYKCLQEIAQSMKNDPSLYLFIEGHCDERASEQYNLALGSKRANCVRKQLISAGVSSDRLFTLSLGKEMPIDSGHSEAAWARNRRAIFKLYRDTK